MSGDVMQFPKTVEEFMEEYKVVDTEHVYTNGTELVPIFRMEQWFEHLRHGKWIKVGDNTYRCSRCNEVSCCNGNFCTDCGARMDEGEL